MPPPVSQGLVEGPAEDEARVLDRVVVVHPSIALRLHGEIDTRVVGEQVQEVVQEAHPGLDLGPSLSVHVDVDLDVGFGRLALRTALTRHLPPA
jgi:hypothetical protein